MKKIYVISFFLVMTLLLGSPVSAESDHNFEDVQQIIDNKVFCAELSDDQLERIGDYYMEQMHPGSAHEAMDEMMGGEGSDSLRQAHIFMARRWYCGDAAGMGMMGMMMGSDIVESGMFSNKGYNNTSMGMMGGSWGIVDFYSGSFWFTRILIWVLLILGIVSFVKYLIFKSK